MRAFTLLLLTALGGTAGADVRGEMAAALEAQADLHPGPVTLPTHAAAQAREATTKPHPGDPHAAAGRANAQAQTPAQALIHQAQAASAAAAGLARAQAAKQRAGHPHGPPHPAP